MRILVTGSREWSDAQTLGDILSGMHRRKPFTKVASGGARGADALAEAWARHKDLPYGHYPVDHSLDGPWPHAGINRNVRMFHAFGPDLVVAFKFGLQRDLERGGTEHMIRYAMEQGCQVKFFGSFSG